MATLKRSAANVYKVCTSIKLAKQHVWYVNLVCIKTNLVSLSAKIALSVISQMYRSIFEAYTPECYYYDLIDLVRRLVLTGGLENTTVIHMTTPRAI